MKLSKAEYERLLYLRRKDKVCVLDKEENLELIQLERKKGDQD